MQDLHLNFLFMFWVKLQHHVWTETLVAPRSSWLAPERDPTSPPDAPHIIIVRFIAWWHYMQWEKNLRSLTSLILRSSAQVWPAVREGKLSSSLPSCPSCEGTSCRGFPQSLKQERFSSSHIIRNWTPASIRTRDLKWKASVLKKKEKKKEKESGNMPPCDVTKGCQSPPGLMTTPCEHRVKCVVPGEVFFFFWVGGLAFKMLLR